MLNLYFFALTVKFTKKRTLNYFKLTFKITVLLYNYLVIFEDLKKADISNIKIKSFII